MGRRVVQTLPQMFITMVKDDQPKKLQVAAYARVSTEKEEQEDSFERQVEHYTQMINAKPDWDFAGIYADPGISGTRAEKRPDFLRMIEDCRAGKIQKVLVKSISRFARNTVDALNYIRELKDLGISVYFESENIDTLTPGGEVLLTILAAMAEQESRTISSNIKWAYQRKFQNGDIVLNTGLMLGYRKTGQKDEDGHDVYEIVEEEAEIVRRIYREYIAGAGLRSICRGLEADGIKTKLGKDTWRVSVVLNILRNEKYTGNALLGKTFKPDVLSKQRQKNDGKKAPIYYVENTHPAIISKEIFDMVQSEIVKRRDAKAATVGSTKYASKYPFSAILVCAECGARLRRHVRTMGTGEKVVSWGCTNRIQNGRSACDSHHVREDVLRNTYLAAIREITDNVDEVLETVKGSIDAEMQSGTVDRLREIENTIIELQEEVLALHKAKQRMAVSAADYASKIKEYGERMKVLEAERDEAAESAYQYTELKVILDTFEHGIKDGSIMSADDTAIMRSLVDQIIVRETEIEIEFKCGVTIRQEYVK